MNRIASFCLLALLAGVPVISAIALPAVVLAAPGFKSQEELNRKFGQVHKGWTKKQVRDLLGEPQWATEKTWNYYIDQRKDIRAIKFTNGKVSGLGREAG